MEKIKQSILETSKLLWSFKWYIFFFMLWAQSSLLEIIYPPAADDPILNYEYNKGSWNYINQKVYIESMKLYFIIDCLVFLVATSNMRNHPKLAKFIFLLPWFAVAVGTAVLLTQLTADGIRHLL